MSDDFSWSPFGSPDQLEPLPPLPDDEGKVVPPAAAVPLPEDVAPPDAPPEPDPVPLQDSKPPPAPVPGPDLGWSVGPTPATPSVPRVPPAMPSSIDMMDFRAFAQGASSTMGRSFQQQISEPGSREAGRALLWGILGVTFLPFFFPSIMAVVWGRRARQASSGLVGHHRRGQWGTALGWIGIAFWTLFIVLAVVGFAIGSQ